ncbi:MAG TPA: amidase [Bryobacteraceae bacterium]|nr:amidase [Bryobacteraceae bacterium]
MPHRLTLTQMSELIRARKLSPVELMDAHLKQIEKHNPQINAFIRILEEPARAAAQAAERALSSAGPILPPLHGIPVSIKDSFNIAGVPTTSGSRFFADSKPARDATGVTRLKQAGAIPIGKTNCPEFLSNYESDNFVAGRTNNPWDLERTPGGSSGGESAAIASFFSAGGFGTDGGGSIRVPAHFTGIAGLKPTPGRVSAAGHVPEMNHPTGMIGVAGPMARNARDLRMLFRALAGYDSEDPFSAPVPIREPDLASVRIGLMPQFYRVPVEAGVARAIEKAARCLADLQFPVEPFQPTGLEGAPNLWWFFFGELPARITAEIIKGREDQAHWTGTEFMQQALAEPEPTAKQILQNLAVRDKMRARLLREMEEFPVILMPPCGIAAFRHRQRRFETPAKTIGLFEAMMPATPVNLLGLPAVVIPFDQDERGLPIGIQLVGRPYEEELLLELAIRMEEARGPFSGPPL